MKIINKTKYILIVLFFHIIIVQITEVYSYTVSCDYMGDCSFIIDNKTFNLPQRHIPLYKEISNDQIDYKWNESFYLLKLEKQIDGVSNFGLLKGTKNGYECSGGLYECKDSCCLDGFCVEILFFCDREVKYVKIVYMLIGVFFLILIILYWITYCLLGCKYKDDLTKTMKEEEELYKFMKIEKSLGSKESTNSASVTENYSHIPMVNNIMKAKGNAIKS